MTGETSSDCKYGSNRKKEGDGFLPLLHTFVTEMLVVLLVNSRLYHYLAQMLLFVEQLSPILSKNKMPNENFLLSNFITDPINTVVGNGAVLNKIFKSAENHFELDLDSNYCSVTPWHV